MNEGHWVLLIASEVGGTDSVSDRAMERLVDAIAKEGYEVVRTSTPEDGLSLVTSIRRIARFCWTGTWKARTSSMRELR